jgi:hypothetical protein
MSNLVATLAYIDPGAGSMILQALAGGIAGLLVMGRLYWARVKRALRFGRTDAAENDPRS